MNILEFARKFTTFKPSSYHEALFKIIEESAGKDKGAQLVSRRWYKNLKLNEFTYLHLTRMTEGQIFAIASPEGMHVFKKIEFRDAQSDKE